MCTTNAVKLTIPIPSMSSLGTVGSSDEHHGAPKSPVTVQDWVNSIDVCDDKADDEHVPLEVPAAAELEDNLGLGDEAHHWRTGDACDGSDRMPRTHEDPAKTVAPDAASQKREAFGATRETQRSLQSELSALSNITVSSVETLLESRRDDPEQLLLSLGFGGGYDPDPVARVPKRFLSRSLVKGNDVKEFLQRQEDTWDALDVGSCGYMGLSGIRFDGNPPSGIVHQLLMKIRENERRAVDQRVPLETVQVPHMRLLDVAFSVMAANTFRASIRPGKKEESILAPENREFLEKQSKPREDEGERRKRRVILGRDSFSIDVDGQLVHAGEVSEPLATRRVASLIADDDLSEEDPADRVPECPPTTGTAAARRATRLRKQAQVPAFVDETASTGPCPDNRPCRTAADYGSARAESAMSNSSGFLEGESSVAFAVQPCVTLRRGSRSLPDSMVMKDREDVASTVSSSPGESTVVNFCRSRLRSMRLACERLDKRMARHLPGCRERRPEDPGQGGSGDTCSGAVSLGTPIEAELRRIKREITTEMQQLFVAERRVLQQELQELRASICAIRTGLSTLLTILDRHWTQTQLE